MEFVFPAHRILSSRQLVQFVVEAQNTGTRFCFILGAGASVESEIASGTELAKRWMDELMGEGADASKSLYDPDDTRRTAGGLREAGLMEYDFSEIEDAWKEAKANGWRTLASRYYFDIYRLRFHIDPNHGYRYLEELMADAEPSMGYHPLAKLLTQTGLSNLVITTNFDSLVEDALFLYTRKKPLVAGHEALAGYIDANISRPIVAKVHRSLMYDPFNTPEDTNHLQSSWHSALRNVLRTHTPIVIGYGGGDRSLMSFLEEKDTVMPNVLWCYREKDGFPEERIQKFVLDKGGCLVAIEGFDGVMIDLGNEMFPNQVTPSATREYLNAESTRRAEKYEKRYNKRLEEKGKASMAKIDEAEQDAEEARAAEGELTANDYYRQGHRAYAQGRYADAVEEFTKAIAQKPDYHEAINYLGSACFMQGDYGRAVEEYSRAIEASPKTAIYFGNRALAYYKLKQYDDAIADNGEAILLNPNYADAYNNRGLVFRAQKEYDKAIADYNEAIRLKPDYATAYLNRGNVFDDQKEYDKAIADYNETIRLKPDHVLAYNNRGNVYHDLKQYDEAVSEYTKALEIDPNYKLAYENRARTYRKMGKIDLAKADEEAAAKLK